MRRSIATSAFVVGILGAAQAVAQTGLDRPLPLPALGRSLVSNGDSTSMVQNPANLAFLPGPEFRWSGYFLNGGAEAASSGHAFGLALPFGFLPIATGLRFDIVTPNEPTAERMGSSGLSYQWLTWNLAVGGEAASAGVSFERSYSNQAGFHGFGTWSVGVNLRPFDFLGFAGVIHAVDAPRSAGGATLGTTYEVGLGVRPLGSDLIDLGAEAQYVDEYGGYWVPRGVLQVGIPDLGRLRADVSVVDAGGSVFGAHWVASTQLVLTGNVRSGSAELMVGSRYGDALGARPGQRFFENMNVEVAIRGFRDSQAADNWGYGVTYRIADTPDSRGHVRLLRDLWALAEERNLRGLVLEIRANPAGSMAHAEELADAIYHLRAQGKKVLCHLEDGSGAALFACSAADQILVSPAGGLRYAGLQSQSFYLQGLLDKLGLSADFVRIGDHKSAPEMFTRGNASDVARSDRIDLLQQVEMAVTSQVARGRHLTVSDVRKIAGTGPFTALDAKQAKLVDGVAFSDMLPDKLNALVGEKLPMEKGAKAAERVDHFGPSRRLAIVYVDGDMVDGKSQTVPFVGMKTAGSATIGESLKQAREDKSIGAVVLRVETGGGSALAADVLWREIQLTAAKKPVIVSMGSAAASGGYYISTAGTYVYANPTTITGSIGIFFGKVELSELLNRIGVNIETFTTTKSADAESIFRPYTDEERQSLKKKIAQYYGLFLRRVADGRHLEKAAVDKVGQGRVWTGRQAKGHKLVDELGGLRQALAQARMLGELRDDAPIVELPVPQTSLLGAVLGVEGLKMLSGPEQAALPAAVQGALGSIAPYVLYRPDEPLARIEVMPAIEP